MKNREYAEKNGRCQGKTFLLIRKNDNKIVGTINVRWNLTEEMKQFGGNIGYGIRPTERRRGYNKINLYLGLIEAKKVGLDKVMLDCDVERVIKEYEVELISYKDIQSIRRKENKGNAIRKILLYGAKYILKTIKK